MGEATLVDDGVEPDAAVVLTTGFIQSMMALGRQPQA